ncbi:hypothetical protein P3T76_004761 [Phytophthora citrophthora]|uniref:Uncharacterized protein n=1 Tax=Phytophthora citrophthora TaxID=4793 RepID=A0AAD9GRR1_9STRA|nr:hypothetical protein P3T76_004761 [Phytophthora citrophthora]
MKKVKGCLVVPQDEQWLELQQPLHSQSSISTLALDSSNFRLRNTGDKKRGQLLASSRVMRDTLMHEMEEITLQEAELGSALELLDYTRQSCNLKHDAIVQRLEDCEKMLRVLEGSTTSASRDVESILNEEERVRWKQTKEMVTTILPEVLTRLEDNIELNNTKIRNVRDKMEKLRSKRLALREEIAVKEEDIALMLDDKDSSIEL